MERRNSSRIDRLVNLGVSGVILEFVKVKERGLCGDHSLSLSHLCCAAFRPRSPPLHPRFILYTIYYNRSYFKTIPDKDADPEILKMETDKCLFTDEGFLPHAQKFKDSQEAFFESYKKVRERGRFVRYALSPPQTDGFFNIRVSSIK